MAPQVSIIIPCFNEIKTIEEIVERIIAQKSINKEIILIDDKSTDGTRELIQKRLTDKCNVIIYHETNLGKGAAIKSGIKKTNGQIILIQDADLEYDPNDYKKIIDQIIYNKKLETLTTYLDVVDPLQGKIAGPAEEELRYKTFYDLNL